MTMSASTSNARRDDYARTQTLLVSSGNQDLFPRIGVVPKERHCPSCDSVVYSRRHRLCGVCAQVLPDDCLFTQTEAQNVETLLRTERQRHRAWLRKTIMI